MQDSKDAKDSRMISFVELFFDNILYSERNEKIKKSTKLKLRPKQTKNKRGIFHQKMYNI